MSIEVTVVGCANLTNQAGRDALEAVLRYWDRADDLGALVDRAENERAPLEMSIRSAGQALAERKREIFEELDAEFAGTVAAIGIPGVRTAAISPTDYLPVPNSTGFKDFSPPGGIRTATQVAYWLTLLTVALRRRDTDYPAFLMLDSPRTALNDADALTAALYRRIVTSPTSAPAACRSLWATTSSRPSTEETSPRSFSATTHQRFRAFGIRVLQPSKPSSAGAPHADAAQGADANEEPVQL